MKVGFLLLLCLAAGSQASFLDDLKATFHNIGTALTTTVHAVGDQAKVVGTNLLQAASEQGKTLASQALQSMMQCIILSTNTLVENINSTFITCSSSRNVIKNNLTMDITPRKHFWLVGLLMGTMSALQKPPTDGAAKRSLSYVYLYLPTFYDVQLVFHSMQLIQQNVNCYMWINA